MWRRFKPRPDWGLVVVVWGLTLFGLIMVGNVSTVEAYRVFGNEWYFLRLQLMWAVFGLGVFWLACFWSLRWLEKRAFGLLMISLVLLVLVLIPGLGQPVLGALRRLSWGEAGFKPAELAKLALAVYL